MANVVVLIVGHLAPAHDEFAVRSSAQGLVVDVGVIPLIRIQVCVDHGNGRLVIGIRNRFSVATLRAAAFELEETVGGDIHLVVGLSVEREVEAEWHQRCAVVAVAGVGIERSCSESILRRSTAALSVPCHLRCVAAVVHGRIAQDVAHIEVAFAGLTQIDSVRLEHKRGSEVVDDRGIRGIEGDVARNVFGTHHHFDRRIGVAAIQHHALGEYPAEVCGLDVIRIVAAIEIIQIQILRGAEDATHENGRGRHVNPLVGETTSITATGPTGEDQIKAEVTFRNVERQGVSREVVGVVIVDLPEVGDVSASAASCASLVVDASARKGIV